MFFVVIDTEKGIKVFDNIRIADIIFAIITGIVLLKE